MVKKVIIAAALMAAFAVFLLIPADTDAAISTLTQSNFSGGYGKNSYTIPLSLDLGNQLDSGENINYADGQLRLADENSDGWFISPMYDLTQIEASIGRVSIQSISTYFSSDDPNVPVWSNMNTQMTIYYRGSASSSWQTAVINKGGYTQPRRNFYQSNCVCDADDPYCYQGYCNPDPNTYFYSDHFQYKVVWKAGMQNNYIVDLRVMNKITIVLMPDSQLSALNGSFSNSASGNSSSSARVSSKRTITSTVTTSKPPNPRLIMINRDPVPVEAKEYNLPGDTRFTLSGKGSPGSEIRINFLQDGLSKANGISPVNDLGNWVVGFDGLPPGAYSLEAQTISADSTSSDKVAFVPISFSPSDIAADTADPPSLDWLQRILHIYLIPFRLVWLGALAALLLLLLLLLVHRRKKRVEAFETPLRTDFHERLRLFMTWRPNAKRIAWIAGSAIIFFGLVAAAIFASFTAKAYLQTADSMMQEDQYSDAASIYQRFTHYRIFRYFKPDIAEKGDTAGVLADSSKNYFAGISEWPQNYKNSECTKSVEFFSKVDKQDVHYEDATNKIFKCEVQTTLLAMNSQYPTADPAITSTSQVSRTVTSKNSASKPSSSGSCSGESWNGFCLTGDAAWADRVKQGLQVASLTTAEEFQIIKDHAKNIDQIRPNLEADTLKRSYGLIPSGLSGCSNWIRVTADSVNAVGEVQHLGPASLASLIYHEALHAERPEFCYGPTSVTHPRMDPLEDIFHQHLLELGY